MAKIQSNDRCFDKALQIATGRFYGRELATLTVEELRLVQKKVNIAQRYLTGARKAKLAMTLEVNRELQRKGIMK